MITWRPVAIFAAVLVTLPAWPWPWLGLLVALILTTALAVVDITLAPSPARVTMWRTGGTTLRLGGSVDVTLHLRNDGDQPIRGLVRDAWTPSAGSSNEKYEIDLPAGSTATMTTTLTPLRRGDRSAVRVTVRSYGPFRFGYRQTGHATADRLTPPWSVRVLPPFHARKHLPEKLARLRVVEGTVARRGRGQGTEFDALREYVPGDDVRSIDWRSSARSSSIVVKNWRVERDRRVLSIIDCGRTSAVRVGDEPRLDAQIEACLLLSTVASYAGDRVDALAIDTQVRAAVDGGSRKNVVPRIITALAPLQPSLVETDFGLVVGEVLRRESKRALVVLFSSLDPGAITESLLPALPQLSARHKVVIATVTDPRIEQLRSSRGSLNSLYRAAAAEQYLLERRKVAAALARYDVDVIEAGTDTFASSVVDRYLALKASGRL
ncbi:DUF58 domain-containing protein [Stackebrandtia soli]|uniref:DUF58 domain-containing protein n=1 Tax=Stackebrandtia soli TaxID=1892856 RepID=UPI0039E7B4FD